MKALLRSGPVQGLLAFLTWAYLWLVLKTVRWTRIGPSEEPGGPLNPGAEWARRL